MTPSTKLGVQCLEAREVPAVATLDAGILRITGTESADNITVRQSATLITVDGVSDTFAVATVSEVWVEGLGGNDTVNLQKSGAVVTKKAVLFGGAGDDKLYGGNGADHLDGGSGDDHLFGYGGNDRLAGDTGDDVLFGGSENDNLAGGGGKDILLGEGGIDRLDGGREADSYLDPSSGENVHDDLFGNTIVGSGYTHHHFLGVAVSSEFGWYDANTVDSVLRREARAADRSGMIDRGEMIALLRAAGDGGSVTGTELDDLKEITANESIGMSAAVRNLSKKVVHGDRANQWFTGGVKPVPLGNLEAGSSDDRLEQLVGKWFLGTDRPLAMNGDRTERFDYQWAGGELFVGGPGSRDVDQGNAGDCYFLSALGAVAERDAGRVEGMFTKNPDGTFTVRFFRDGVAEYVTVDRYLPAYKNGFVFANRDKGLKVSDPANELWVALAEKAYAQANESGWTGQDGTNSYNGVGGPMEAGTDGKVGKNYDGINWGNGQTALHHVSGAGTSGWYAGSTLFGNLHSAFHTSGKAIVFSSNDQDTTHGVKADHLYMMVGSDGPNRRVTLRNPHGPGTADLVLDWEVVQANFGWIAYADV